MSCAKSSLAVFSKSTVENGQKLGSLCNRNVILQSYRNQVAKNSNCCQVAPEEHPDLFSSRLFVLQATSAPLSWGQGPFLFLHLLTASKCVPPYKSTNHLIRATLILCALPYPGYCKSQDDITGARDKGYSVSLGAELNSWQASTHPVKKMYWAGKTRTRWSPCSPPLPW